MWTFHDTFSRCDLDLAAAILGGGAAVQPEVGGAGVGERLQDNAGGILRVGEILKRKIEKY